LLKPENTALVLIDVQGKLANIVHESETLLKNIEILIQGAKLLDIPIVWLEQYPEGLGATKEVLQQHLITEKPIAKKVFSACQNDLFQGEIKELKCDHFLVVGIEAHICVYQTVMELLQAKQHVEVVVDAISSRTLENKMIAIDKMKAAGAGVTSVEMALFELMRTAEHAHFKTISKLIK